MLYRLLWALVIRGRLSRGIGGGVTVPFSDAAATFVVDLLAVFWEERVVGGEDLSNQELSVELDLLRARVRSAASPSVLELPEESPLVVLVKEAFERRRRLRSLRKEGIAIVG